MKTNNKPESEAWEILTPEEQLALSLALGHDKSTWEVGEIMGKAHYKYLEIKNRAEMFFKMFTEHIEKHGKLIPDGVDLPKDFQEFIHAAIIQRKKVQECIEILDDKRYYVAQLRDFLIEEALKVLTTTDAGKDLHELIMEFDRWNNFRILPKHLQEPSAFKRREKTRQLKHLKSISSIPLPVIAELEHRYDYVRSNRNYYVPIVQLELDTNYTLIRVRKYKKTHLLELSKIGLPIYKTKAEAIAMVELVIAYLQPSKKSCSHGQEFWPRFRAMHQTALNYKELNGIVPSRTRLINAFVDLAIPHTRKKDRIIKAKKEI